MGKGLAGAAIIFFLGIFLFGLASAYNYDCVYSGVSQCRLYQDGHHFLSIVNSSGIFDIRGHPGNDVNGWGSSLYLQPFLPGAFLQYSKIEKISVYSDRIEVVASGNVSKGTTEKYGAWKINMSFNYNSITKEVSGSGKYSINLSGSLSSSTGDLNLYKLASNYLSDVSLRNGSIGDTGDMKYADANKTGNNHRWIPDLEPGYFPGDTTNYLSVTAVGDYNQIQENGIDAAYKPSMKVILNSPANVDMIFGAIYDTNKNKDPYADNVGITPLILKSSASRNFNFDVEFNSAAIPGDPNITSPVNGSLFVKANSTNFILNNKSFYFAGTNAYYLFYAKTTSNCVDTNRQGCLLNLLDSAKALNLSVIRIWGSSENGSRFGYDFQPSPGVYDQTTFIHFDRVIKEASDRNLKLIVVLTNNWDSFGGMCQYVKWCNIPNSNLCKAGEDFPFPNANVHDAFYTDNCTKDLYKNYVNYFLNRVNTLTGVRYKDDPTIFAWELANEPRARSDKNCVIINDWIGEMSQYIKSIDSNHLVTGGVDGGYKDKGIDPYAWWYKGYEGQDYIPNNNWGSIDFTTFNFYDDVNRFPVNGTQWISEHILDAKNIIKKPVIIQEFNTIDVNGRPQIISSWYNQFENLKIDGDTIWMLSDFRGADENAFEFLCPQDSSICDVVSKHASYMVNLSSFPKLNHAPVIQPINDIITNENETIIITVNATDEDNDNLTYSINDSRFNQTGNIFTWKTRIGDSGVYYFRISVSDGKGSVSRDFKITINELYPACTIPTSEINITKNTILCKGNYSIPYGITITGSNLILDCNGANLTGNYSSIGIYLENVNNVVIKNCSLEKYSEGIKTKNTTLITIANNNIPDGLWFEGTNSTIFQNKINGARGPLVWEHSLLARGSNINIYSNDIQGGGFFADHLLRLNGIYYSRIFNNSISNVEDWGRAISLDTVYNTVIENNSVIGGNAIFCWYECFNDIITGNNFIRSSVGINEETIWSVYYSNTTVYHNNFINNTKNIINRSILNKDNIFYYNNQGNYWSNYDSPEEGCNDLNKDGICDLPYVLGNNSDNYPFRKQNGWYYLLPGDTNKDYIVDIFDLAKVGLCFNQPVSGSCISADLKKDERVDIFDLATVGLNFGNSY